MAYHQGYSGPCSSQKVLDFQCCCSDSTCFMLDCGEAGTIELSIFRKSTPRAEGLPFALPLGGAVESDSVPTAKDVAPMSPPRTVMKGSLGIRLKRRLEPTSALCLAPTPRVKSAKPQRLTKKILCPRLYLALTKFECGIWGGWRLWV